MNYMSFHMPAIRFAGVKADSLSFYTPPTRLAVV